MTAVRYQEFKGPSEPFKPPTASNYRLEFRNPDTGEKVIWEYSRDLATVALSINDKVPELVTTPNYATLRFRCPDPPYVAFRYIDGQWVRVALTDLARKVFVPNMTVWSIRLPAAVDRSAGPSMVGARCCSPRTREIARQDDRPHGSRQAAVRRSEAMLPARQLVVR